jgi:predicted lipoprotein with Yx(FWY)xxD motif
MGHRELSIFRRLGVIAALASACVVTGAALAASTTLTTEKNASGKIVVTSTRHALYMFTGRSCSGACARAWHALIASGRVTVAKGSGLNSGRLGKARLSNGTSQVTYNHHPLYTYVGDKKAGQATGEGISSFGGHWFLVSPAGNAVKCPQGEKSSSSGCIPGGY